MKKNDYYLKYTFNFNLLHVMEDELTVIFSLAIKIFSEVAVKNSHEICIFKNVRVE